MLSLALWTVLLAVCIVLDVATGEDERSAYVLIAEIVIMLALAGLSIPLGRKISRIVGISYFSCQTLFITAGIVTAVFGLFAVGRLDTKVLFPRNNNFLVGIGIILMWITEIFGVVLNLIVQGIYAIVTSVKNKKATKYDLK